jgi:recombination protein RecT
MAVQQSNKSGTKAETVQGTTQALDKKSASPSERFMDMVLREFGSGVGEAALTNFQKRLAQNYFMAADMALKNAETKRQNKLKYGKDEREKKKSIPVVWENVKMLELAQYVVSSARIGLDPFQENHVSLIPFKDNAVGKYGMTFMIGYRGKELKAKKYGLDVPDSVTVELVHTNDRFKSIKKDKNNPYDTYEFEIIDDFDRGTIRGGFYYHRFSQNPEKNKLTVFTLADIEKRKPKYAAAEFWGGEKDVWTTDEKTGKRKKTTEHTDGWYEKMCWKTIFRAAYGDITIDSEKIDADYQRLKAMEESFESAKAEQEVELNANNETVDIEPDGYEVKDDVDTETGEIIEPEAETEKEAEKEDKQQGEPKQGEPKQGEPKQGEPKQGEPKQGEPKQGEPKQASIDDGPNY